MSHVMPLILALATVLAGGFASAAQPTRPQAEYSADSTMQTKEGTIQQHVYVTPTKERKELLAGAGEGAVQIFRYDSKVLWMLMPSEHMYMEYSLSGGQAQGQENDPSQWTYEDTVVGEDTLNGVKVTKYKTIATSTDGKKFGGFSWRTREGINVKQDLLYKEGNDKKRMLIELSNLAIGRQDPALFEIPEGFTKLDMGGMMGMMGAPGRGRPGMGQPAGRPDMGAEGMGRPNMGRGQARPQVMPPPAPQEPEPSGDERSDMQKANEFMKGLFGR